MATHDPLHLFGRRFATLRPILERCRARIAARQSWLLSIGVGALLIRVLALWCDRHAPLFKVGGLDADRYLAMANGVWSGDWPGPRPHFWAPGYPLFLAGLGAVSKSITWFKLVQAGVGAATCMLVGRLTWLLFEDRRTVLVAAGIAALYGPLVYYDLQISPATLDVFLAIALLVSLLELARDGAWRWALAAGCVAAASAITRGGVLLFAPLALLWIWGIRARRSAKFARCLTFALPIVASVGLVSAHNYRYDVPQGDEASAYESQRGLSLISFNLGINFLLGNDPDLYATNDIEHPLCFIHYKMALDEPPRHGVLAASAQSRFLVRKALDRMQRDPAAWLRLMLHKAGELLRGEEISRDTSIYANRLDNPVIALLIWKYGLAFPTGLLIPLALLGASIARLPRRSGVLLALFLCSQAAFVLGFFVTTRYRLPCCAAAVPLAARGLLGMPEVCRALSAAWPRLRLALGAGMLVLCNSALQKLPDRHLPFEYNHRGLVLAARGKTEAAVRNWRAALELDREFVPAHFQLALHYRSTNALEIAAAHFEEGLRLAPTAYSAREDYARLLLARGSTDAALTELETALAHAPGVQAQRRICSLREQLRLPASPACARRS